jgi:signal transduction histidine kinase
MKILIVDDSPANLKLLRAMLDGESLEVVEAADGVQALALLEYTAVDAIISDILMPNMDGYRLCQEVRKSQRWGELPFIFYTATYNSIYDEKLCYDLGGDQYLRKPASTQALLAALTEAVSASRNRPAHRAGLPSEDYVMKEYNERLVSKLEEKNLELEQARTDLQQANRELDSRVQQRTVELKTANAELESFAHTVSHDLRAPLRHIGGYIDLVLRDGAGRLDEANLKHLHIVRDAARTMGELIDALLDLSKMTHAEIHRRPMDLSALAAEVFAELQQSDPQRVVKMEITPGLNANGDLRLLRVVLVNLLGNAWKYSRKRPDARIEFGKIADGAGDAYFVRDNGAGFDMAYAGKLFGAFQRLHGSDEFEGLGIGLATVRRIIHRHNGTVRAESIGHQGATFYFTLGNSG